MTTLKRSGHSVSEGMAIDVRTVVVLTPERLAKYIANECSSHEMALFINAMGVMNQNWQLTTCHAAAELSAEGRAFIDDLHEFMHDGGLDK